MKKTLLLWILSLTLGALALDGMAQQAAPDKKIRIILKEDGGEPRVYEYDSIEEMQADERLQGKILPIPKGARHFSPMRLEEHQVLLLEADSLRLLADSMRMEFALRFAEGDSLRGRHRIFMQGEPHNFAQRLQKQLEKGMSGVHFKDVEMLRHQPLSFEPLPEASQKLLREHGLELKEGEQVVILRTLDSMPIPPPPPPVPGIQGVPPVPEPAPAWLSEIQVFPNPAADQLQLRFRAKNSGPAVLRILDLNGKEVYKEEIADAALLQDKTIKLPTSKKGVFLLQLEQGGHKYMQRVLLK